MRLVVGGDERQMRARAVVVDQPVMRQAVEPRRELGSGRVARASPDQIHPYVLEEFVGDTALAALTQQVAVHAALVPGVKRSERRGVAGGVREHEVFVGRRGRSGHGPPSMRGGPCGGKRGSLCYCRGSGTKRPASGNGLGRNRASGGEPTGTPCASRFSYESK